MVFLINKREKLNWKKLIIGKNSIWKMNSMEQYNLKKWIGKTVFQSLHSYMSLHKNTYIGTLFIDNTYLFLLVYL